MNKIGLEMVEFQVFIDGNAINVATLGGAKQAQIKKILSQNDKEKSIVEQI
jgi:hypothetical protein